MAGLQFEANSQYDDLKLQPSLFIHRDRVPCKWYRYHKSTFIVAHVDQEVPLEVKICVVCDIAHSGYRASSWNELMSLLISAINHMDDYKEDGQQ